MDQYHTQPISLGQENRHKKMAETLECSDCHTIFPVSLLARSGQCPHCGNIMMRQERSGEVLAPEALENTQGAAEWKADGHKVNEILYRYQNEWQIWNKVVENFADPNFHFAYLTAITSTNSFAIAQERYQKHRAAMAFLAEEIWQADIADKMIEKIQAMAGIRMAQEGVRRTTLFDFLIFAPFSMRFFKVLWLVGGMVLLALLGR